MSAAGGSHAGAADRHPAIRRALLSAWRKEGVADFGRWLSDRGVEILSTGGTARCLRDAGVPVRDVADVTGFPEMLDGRVKTLHPRIHGGLLFRRDVPAHAETAAAHGISPIDLLLVDLYPFEEAAAREGAPPSDVIEMIDIGGPAMVRSASKNHADVVVVTDVLDLPQVREEIERERGATSIGFRRRLAAKAFRRTAAYDAAIAVWLSDEKFPERLVLSLERAEVARYGENPHQEGALYRLPASGEAAVARAVKLSGKEMSYNNWLDASAAWDVVRGFERPAAAVVKHRNPCGAALDDDIVRAFQGAFDGDPVSAFGGILAVNRPFTAALARAVADPKKFFEVIVAPAVEPDAVTTVTGAVKWGRSVRILALPPASAPPGGLECRSIGGGVLVQDRDLSTDREWVVATARKPSEAEAADLRFAWEVCRHVTSNAIVFARGVRILGCGAGQMSRVDSVRLAAARAGAAAAGAVMASDAFFPFADGIEAAAAAGITAVIQPGGSVRDADVIRACDDRGVAMVLTGRRHFRH